MMRKILFKFSLNWKKKDLILGKKDGIVYEIFHKDTILSLACNRDGTWLKNDRVIKEGLGGTGDSGESEVTPSFGKK